MKRTIFLLLILLATNVYSQELETQDWITDIEFLKTELEKKHKNLYFKISKEQFEKELNSIIKELDADSDLQTAIKLKQLISKIGDSHTGINIFRFTKRKKGLPIKMSWFKDGYYIIKTTKNNYDLLDKKIISINNYPIQKVVDSLKTLITADNNAIIKARIPNVLNMSSILSYFDFSKASDSIYQFEVEDYNGYKSKHSISLAINNRRDNIETKIDGVRPYYIDGKGKIFKEKYYAKEQIYYVQYNKCMSKESVLKYGNKNEAYRWPSFQEFENKVLETLEKEPVQKLIFDMRFNKGGSSYLAQNLIKKIAENKNINTKERLFVVIGNSTYSSAIWNTIDFKKWTNATIIGEETSGKPNHYGYVKYFYLPYSNMKITFSTEYYELWDKDDNSIKPDIEVTRTFEDYKNGIDPILEYVKNNK
ncbi:hypothetical protein [Winogradskyella sp. Asnod2-B02-A]|uniref:hypothetical protein n=1 Tax=Winogradskyella sp. Asnod2-B02-A TaxID=3160583 RepID=UPI003863CC8B